MNERFTLDLTVQQLNTIISGLVKLSIETGLETFNEVQKQIQQQQQANQPQGPLGDKVINN